MGADRSRVVGVVGVGGGFEDEGEFHRRLSQRGVRLKLDVDVGFRALIATHRAIGARRSVIPKHHVVLDHAEPPGLGIEAGSGRVLNALKLLPLGDVGSSAVRARFFVVPQGEADRHLGLHIRSVEDAGQLHHQRGARAIVVDRLVDAVAVHVAADDVHLVGSRRADFGAVDLGTLSVHRLLAVQLADTLVGLGVEVSVDSCTDPVAKDRAAAGTAAVAADQTACRRRQIGPFRRAATPTPCPADVTRRRSELIGDSLGVGATHRLELCLDPVDRVAVALGSLAPIAELGQPLERRLVVVERQTVDEYLSRIVLGVLNQRGGRRCWRCEGRAGRGARHGECRGDGEQ